MSQTAITLAFEQWKAQQAATDEPVMLDEFVFALVPGLDPDLPVDRNEMLPPAAQIVYRAPVDRKGVVNDNAVVHSAVLGADVGDFSFNWIGLINKATATLAMIVHAPEQQKLKTKEGQQGNVLTRSFLMEYNGAQTETGINTPAETWQIDFTARMAAMDERQRVENIDIYSAAAFFGDGWLVGKSGNQYFVTKGAGYVAGLRAVLTANQNITVTKKPVSVWLDVCWTGALTSVWGVQSKIIVADSMEDYGQDGIKHYVCALASIDENGNITDLRPKGSLPDRQANEALRQHEQSRNHPDASLTEKGFVRLSNSVTSDSESLAATSRAVKAASDNANSRLSADNNLSDLQDNEAGRKNLGLGNLAVKDSLDATDVNAVQAGGGEGMAAQGLNQIMLGWSGERLLAQIDSAPLGTVFNETNPPTPEQVGAVPLSGGTMSGQLSTTNMDSYRIKAGDRAFFLRFDGSDFYILKTAAGDPDGSWDDARPLKINAATGAVTMETDLNVSFGGMGHVFQRNGDIVETSGTSSIFRGYWGATNLEGALRNITNRADDAWNKANDAQVNRVSDIRFTSEHQVGATGVWDYRNGNTVLSGFTNGDGDYSPEGLFWSYIQYYRGGQWITVGRS
ncbi:phage tail protein [Pantoea sp. JZ2]|uniref:phage tail-collar fiber domain-containing protein n=1 Tax=Pantoea sp. JZ2 TaxID=2654189 RepID=UPI002B46B642|nr:phage tail protein [Pantoea sp. JZ2]